LNAKIVIASTLKPVIDPRAYEKIGKSLVKTGNYEINIIGSYPSTDQTTSGITLYPCKSNRSNFIQRLMLPWKIFKIIIQIKPDLLIVSTHELLFIAVFYKLIYRNILFYDISENYYFNLLYQNNYPWGGRHLLAIYVRVKELILSYFINHFLLAEKCYKDELSFVGKRYTVLENKYKPVDTTVNKPTQNKVEFFLSGTISKEYGVFDAVSFIKQFDSEEYKLIIIGHCPNNSTYRKIVTESKNINNIELIISSQPIPQSDIINKIGTRTIGLLPYQANKSTINKVPTKLYEYIGLGIPVLVSHNPKWADIIEKHSAGLSIDFNTPVPDSIKSRIDKLSIGSYSTDLKDIIWYSEEVKLLDLIKRYI